MAAPQNTIALIFDFDDTLTDDSTSQLLEAHGIDTADFWKNQVGPLVNDGWETPLAYLKLILDNVGEGKPFGKLTNKGLRKFGKGLKFYPGIPELFSELRKLTKKHPVSNPSIEFYIVSGGLEEVIRGSSIARHFSGIWGCQFAEEGGMIRHVKRAISFTEKTKYIFEINKGIASAEHGPYEVNRHVAKQDRRVPLHNMIYVGDGLTDVPCFSLLDNSDGFGFGVFDPTKPESPKKAWESLVAPRRVRSMNSPQYGVRQDLGALLVATVSQICVDLDLRTRTALSRQT